MNFDAGPFAQNGLRSRKLFGQALNATAPLRRDTVLIPAGNWLVIRFITDNRTLPPLPPYSSHLLTDDETAGVWAFHCHIGWHMEAGLMMQFNSLPLKQAKLHVPQDVVSLCSARH